MQIGMRVRTLYEFSATGTIVRPRKGEGTPSAEWFVVRFDDDGGRLCIHREMLAIRND